ncbi:MAG: galactokinase, partial [Planctomycetota bacterium]
MNDKSAAAAVEGFTQTYGRAPEGVAFAPGRVNIIGEHTDYNGGWVLPAAVDLATYVAFAPRADARVLVFTAESGESAEFELDESAKEGLAFWARYPWGTGMSLLEAGLPARPVDMYSVSTVPLGGGLSSSASFEVALALAYLGLPAASTLEKDRLVHICRRAENHFVGVNCGVMDQFSSVFGARGKAFLLDCRSLEANEVPFPEKMSLVVADTTVRHALGEETEGYHKRQDECRRVVEILKDRTGTVDSLRDVTGEMLKSEKERLGDVLFRRARHVITENERVLEAAEALVA